MELGISSYCLIGRPLAETLDTLSGITGLIEVMDEGPHLITDPAVFESYSQDFVIHAPYHGMNIASLFCHRIGDRSTGRDASRVPCMEH